jgi:hypothetical protein
MDSSRARRSSNSRSGSGTESWQRRSHSHSHTTHWRGPAARTRRARASLLEVAATTAYDVRAASMLVPA